jgi:hypothetical protein
MKQIKPEKRSYLQPAAKCVRIGWLRTLALLS